MLPSNVGVGLRIVADGNDVKVGSAVNTDWVVDCERDGNVFGTTGTTVSGLESTSFTGTGEGVGLIMGVVLETGVVLEMGVVLAVGSVFLGPSVSEELVMAVNTNCCWSSMRCSWRTCCCLINCSWT